MQCAGAQYQRALDLDTSTHSHAVPRVKNPWRRDETSWVTAAAELLHCDQPLWLYSNSLQMR